MNPLLFLINEKKEFFLYRREGCCRRRHGDGGCFGLLFESLFDLLLPVESAGLEAAAAAALSANSSSAEELETT